MAGPQFSFLPLGAILQSATVKGINVVLGFPLQDQYREHNTAYFGETIGRVANRIKDAKIDCLNGQTYALPPNNGPNCLHGGIAGWGKRLWSGPVLLGSRPIPGVDDFTGGNAVAYSLRSGHCEEGFPGAVDARVIYTAGTQTSHGHEVSVLAIEYEASLVGEADETVINMTNHSYFNLSGDATIDGTTVTLATRQHLPVDNSAIPHGSVSPFPALDTNHPFVLGTDAPDIDHCFVVSDDPSSVPIDTRSWPLVRNLSAYHPKTGIHLEVLSTEPAFQFYTGRYIDVPAVDGAPARGPRSGFCCEPGRLVNACNMPKWKGMTVLKRGDTYGARIVYRLWAD